MVVVPLKWLKHRHALFWPVLSRGKKPHMHMYKIHRIGLWLHWIFDLFYSEKQSIQLLFWISIFKLSCTCLLQSIGYILTSHSIILETLNEITLSFWSMGSMLWNKTSNNIYLIIQIFLFSNMNCWEKFSLTVSGHKVCTFYVVPML